MTGIEQLFRYDGKRVLVIGAATGMGAAAAKGTAELGAEVVAMDVAPVDYDVTQSISVDLSDPASIDSAIDQLDGPVSAVFSAAGIADGPKVMKINFIGHRHLLEKLLATDKLPRGSAICFISSVAGIGWENDLPRLLEFLATPDYESADAWITEREADYVNSYAFSKQAINAYVATKAFPFISKGVRINAICPGPTDTPLARANADLWLTFGKDYREATGVGVHTPEQMANAMVFLNSDAAGAISGINLLVDNGHVMSSSTGSFAPDKPIIDLIMGRLTLT
jgi:NAD(P)-dependent dehydrogenase (short-subunit alcohol dehydrogenase family)